MFNGPLSHLHIELGIVFLSGPSQKESAFGLRPMQSGCFESLVPVVCRVRLNPLDHCVLGPVLRNHGPRCGGFRGHFAVFRLCARAEILLVFAQLGSKGFVRLSDRLKRFAPWGFVSVRPYLSLCLPTLVYLFMHTYRALQRYVVPYLCIYKNTQQKQVNKYKEASTTS